MIVTIDGPSASGKTSVARDIAHRLGFALLRTGAMYRALALAAHRHQLDDRSHEAELLQQLNHWQIDADEEFVFLNGTDVSHEIEGNTMSHLSSLWAEVPEVRKHITGFIRQRAASYLVDGPQFRCRRSRSRVVRLPRSLSASSTLMPTLRCEPSDD